MRGMQKGCLRDALASKHPGVIPRRVPNCVVAGVNPVSFTLGCFLGCRESSRAALLYVHPSPCPDVGEPRCNLSADEEEACRRGAEKVAPSRKSPFASRFAMFVSFVTSDVPGSQVHLATAKKRELKEEQAYLDKATELYRAVLGQQPNNAYAANGLGIVCAKKGARAPCPRDIHPCACRGMGA